MSARATEAVTNTYDALGRLVGRTSAGSVNNNKAVTFCFDGAGNRVRMVADSSGVLAVCPVPTPSPTPTSSTSNYVVVPLAGFTLIFPAN